MDDGCTAVAGLDVRWNCTTGSNLRPRLPGAASRARCWPGWIPGPSSDPPSGSSSVPPCRREKPVLRPSQNVAGSHRGSRTMVVDNSLLVAFVFPQHGFHEDALAARSRMAGSRASKSAAVSPCSHFSASTSGLRGGLRHRRLGSRALTRQPQHRSLCVRVQTKSQVRQSIQQRFDLGRARSAGRGRRKGAGGRAVVRSQACGARGRRRRACTVGSRDHRHAGRNPRPRAWLTRC